jgi:lysozyme
MKKTLLYITLPFVVLIGATYALPRPAKASRVSIASYSRDSRTSSVSSESSNPKIQAEIKYYLDRHNVQDEGYEMVIGFIDGKRHHIDINPHVTLRNVGTWKGYSREGTVITLDTLGRTILAICQADTLVTAIRADEKGTYQGDFSQTGASGHGSYLAANGSYYEGRWEQDKKQGFGLEMVLADQDNPRLRVGEWRKNRFMGERMKYTSERIYGIDIARYQHGKGRRPTPILWDQLRITHVGKNGSHNVRGKADYPVSFVYIKSTEGTTVRNKFYVNDYTQARKHGIRAGAYHFFSTKTSGAAQAKHFIRNTLFREGDLPPVLDVEPSKSQIQQMGGPEAMFHHIRVWLNAVEQWTGVKPVLYVNQMFVNNYLSEQEDLKRDYRVWIARYSEYKPDVRLTYWQLCPDGRVAGIQGDVDINVFNGYQSQFDEFVANETIQ